MKKTHQHLTDVLKQQLDKTLSIETGASTSFFYQLKDYSPLASIGTLKLYLQRYQQLKKY